MAQSLSAALYFEFDMIAHLNRPFTSAKRGAMDVFPHGHPRSFILRDVASSFRVHRAPFVPDLEATAWIFKYEIRS